MSSKQQAQADFARFVQTDLQARGLYAGEIDEWPGPMTMTGYRKLAGIEGEHAPEVVVPDVRLPDDLPKPAAQYSLPRENDAALNAFYGTASSSPNYLDWFSFPHPQTRLYSRTGELLKNRFGDERLDHTCHRLLVGRLTAALAEIYVRLGRGRFEKEGWHVYGGCHNYRSKTGGSGLSTHAWAIAIDLNPNENPYAKTSTTFSDEGINIMERWGFLSGGRAWGKDWMHFQACIPNISSGSYYAKYGLPKNIVRV